MSRNDHMDPASLDLNKPDVIHALIALDTELNSLHRLCMEQGPFFKCLFEEISSDALRHGLKQNLPRQPANQSHSERGYWKKQITRTQIETIKRTVGTFKVQWNDFYTRYQRDQFIPQSHWDHTQSPVTLIDIQFGEFNGNIIAICEYLTTPHDTTNTYTPAQTDLEESQEESRKSFELLDRLRACMHWVELNYNDIQEQDRVESGHTTLLHKICGVFSASFGFGMAPTWNARNLHLVCEFEVEMQTVIDRPHQNDTALLRQGKELIQDLQKLRLEFQTEQPIEAPPASTKQKTDSALSGLLARLTDRANMS